MSSNNHYDANMVIKESSDIHGRSLRTTDSRCLVPDFYTHFRAVYNGANDPTRVLYYRGTEPQKTNITTVASTILNNKYFCIFSAPNQKKYTIWYNVNNTGTEPIVAGTSEYIEVDIDSTSESAVIVAILTEFTTRNALGGKFLVQRSGPVVEYVTVENGETDLSLAGTSGFAVVNTLGTQETVSDVTIEYDGSGNPFFQGQVLKKMNYDIFSGKFIIKNSSSSSSGGGSANVEYATQDVDDTGTGITYVGGVSVDGGVYQIKRITETGADLAIRYATIANNPSSANYASAWTNRLTLVYV